MDRETLKRIIDKDPRYKALLDALPSEQRESFDAYIVSFMEQFYGVLSKAKSSKENDGGV